MSDLLKDLVWDSLVKAVLTRLFAAVPILGWGPIGVVVTWAAQYFADALYDAMKMAFDLEVIVLRNEAHRKAFDAASIRLKVMAHDFGVDSPQFRKARDEDKQALSNFVQFHP